MKRIQQLALSTATEPPLATPVPQEQALAPEQNPPGDIPDRQAFVVYTSSSGGYALEVPEGWARTEQGTSVRFLNTFDGLSITTSRARATPSAAAAKTHEVTALIAQGRAVTVDTVEDVTRPGGTAMRVVGSANSDPDPVTNKQVRLEQHTYIFYTNGQEALLTL